jgi:hypothetical protein
VRLAEGKVERLHVDVSGWSTKLIRSQQDPAFQHEVVAELSSGEPVDESFKTVDGQHLASGSTSRAQGTAGRRRSSSQCSREVLQCLADRLLCAREANSHLHKVSRLRAAAAQPCPQGLGGEFISLGSA